MSETDPLSSSIASDPDEWPSKLTATLVGYVDTARSATTGKALVASRYLVYFLAIALIGVIVAILSLILLVRLLVVASGALLPFVDQGEVWFAYLVIGAVFTGIGMLLWRKKDA